MTVAIGIAAMLLGISACGEVPEVSQIERNTSMMEGFVCITNSQERVFFAADYGAMACWDHTSQELRAVAGREMQVQGLFAVRGTDEVLLDTSTPRKEPDASQRQLVVVDVATRQIKTRIEVPDGPPLACAIGRDRLAVLCWDVAARRTRTDLLVFRVSDKSCERISNTVVGGIPIEDMIAVQDDLLAIHLVRRIPNAHSPKSQSEVALLDVSTGKVVSRVHTADGGVRIGSLAVSADGTHVAVCGEMVEVREVPSLTLVKRRSVPAAFRGACIALSPHGDHIAFGAAALAIWDVQKNEFHVVDSLRQDIADSATDLTRTSTGTLDPLAEFMARRQYATAAVGFDIRTDRLLAVTHDGWYLAYDVPFRHCIERIRIADVTYRGRI